MSDTNSKPNGSSTGNRVMDFLCERSEFSAPGATNEIWEDIIDGAIDDQHAVMEKADMLPPEATLIEPFAGRGDLVRMLRELNLCARARLYDIEPAAKGIKCRDTLTSFPHNAGVVVTNPPWLARNSATRRGLPFPYCEFDDLYKHCLSVCLENADYVAAIIPASFLSSGNFGRNIGDFVESINERLEKFRDETSDVFLTPFKGLRRDGKYRQRLDYALAREFTRGARV